MTLYSASTLTQPPTLSREVVLQRQQQSFQSLLRYVWQRSSFYRELYSGSGIREVELGDVTPSDLPLINKKLLMEHFDNAVTDPRLRKQDLERWIHENHDPAANYHDDFVVVHSSGSSGSVGIFVYSQTGWQLAASAVAGLLPPPANYSTGKTKAAFYLASHGHFGGVSVATRTPRGIYDTLILSVLDSYEHVASKLNDFQPHQLHGYSSSVYDLSQLAMTGKLRISPKRIFVGGDKLTSSMERKIRQVWDVPVYDFYGASESNYIAVRGPGDDEMNIFEELNILEVLNDENHPALHNQDGRVVLTNLYNYALPIIRYELGDHITLGRVEADPASATIKNIWGRTNDALPVILRDGTRDTISPHVLGEFYVPGLEKVQYVSLRSNFVRINYEGRSDLDTVIRTEFQRILDLKGASNTAFEIARVARIASDTHTGKYKLVEIQHDPKAAHIRVNSNEKPEESFQSESGDRKVAHETERLEGTPASFPPEQQAIRAKCFHPTGRFVPFLPEEIEQSIPERFEKILRMYPDRLAVKARDHILTYSALNEKANQIAHAILSRCGRAQEPIALFMENSAAMIAAILGVLKTGKFYVPLNASFSSLMASHILADSQTRLIVTNSRNLSSVRAFAQGKRQCLNIDELDSSTSTENFALSISPNNLAYILYTSGSTGQPKGVVQNHRNVLHKIMNYTNSSHICTEDRLSLLVSLSFSAAVTNMFSALLNGATLHLFDLKEANVRSLVNWLIQQKITVYQSVTTVFRYFLDTLTGNEEFPDLRLIDLFSEPVSAKDIERYQRHFSRDCILRNRLASTETGDVCHYSINKESRITESVVPVGHVIEGAELLLLDEQGKAVGFDQVGEIAVRSRNLALGYWGNPSLTQASFLPDPQGADQRIYLTGDLGRMLPNACLAHLGRKDLRVKIRGYTVEPQEIETALLGHPAIKETIVIAQDDLHQEKRLVAYVVSGEQLTPASHELRMFLQNKLPDYMVPSVFMLLDALPLAPNGKVDRQALPEPENIAAQQNKTSVAPRNSTEEMLAGIWARLLGLERVGIHDDFFDLGGHSLLAARLFAEIEKEFRVSLSLSSLFEGATIERLAGLISQWNFLTPRTCLVPMQPKGTKRPFFCVHDISGDVLCYMKLASHLGRDQPFYGLQARGLDGAEEPFADMKAMAAHYIEEIQTVQPHGPYALGGFSAGGLVAFEMAQQLRANGETVAMVALLDSPAVDMERAKHRGTDSLVPDWRSLHSRVPVLLSWLIGSLQLTPRQCFNLLRLWIRSVKARFAAAFCLWGVDYHLTSKRNMLAEMGDLFRWSEHHLKITVAHYEALKGYRLQAYPGPLTLFSARMQPLIRRHRYGTGWEKLAAGGLQVRVVPGHHLVMLQEPHVGVLAKQLREELKDCFDEAQS